MKDLWNDYKPTFDQVFIAFLVLSATIGIIVAITTGYVWGGY